MPRTVTSITLPKRRDAHAPAKAQTAFREHYCMPKVSDDFLAMSLDARILDPKRRPDVAGRKTDLELYGMAGTPRKASARHAFNRKAVERSRPNLAYVPPEHERSYSEEIEHIVDLQEILAIPKPAAQVTSKAAFDNWERSIFG